MDKAEIILACIAIILASIGQGFRIYFHKQQVEIAKEQLQLNKNRKSDDV
jgi:hypothetical protein